MQQRTEVLTDIPGKLGFFDSLPEYDTELFVNKKSKSTLRVEREVPPPLPRRAGELRVERTRRYSRP